MPTSSTPPDPAGLPSAPQSSPTPSPHLSLEPATRADAELLARLHAESWRHAYAGLVPVDYLEHQAAAERRATWRARMEDDAEGPLEVTIARVDGEAAGFACLMPLAEPGYGIYLDNLHVLPAYHGQGLGKRLLAHCVRRVATEWPGKALFLYVLADNEPARGFYRALGGEESEPFLEPFHGTDVMVPVLRVTWFDVDALLARLTPRA
ncbi:MULTISPECIES: GNAT family N-acetyltransferase [unclassified Cupriavidus]|uniref:GNAT family N-acetyltransferase n=1 Tax=Cupriavidus sp. H19C3 TaxID=3241603 RepID=UPI003BF840F0